jgi:protein-tyrosine phosphatase
VAAASVDARLGEADLVPEGGSDRFENRLRQAALPLPSVPNLRDLGGYVSASGRRVRGGWLFRSSALDRLTSEDSGAFLRLNLRTICDFRSPHERHAAPYRRPAGCGATLQSFPIVSSVGSAMRELMMSGRATPETYRALLTQGYRGYVRDHVERFRALFACLLDKSAYPLLFHCSAGKDRTGMAAALVLGALGVDRAAIEDDYLLTNAHWDGGSPFTRSAPPDLVPTIIKADLRYLDAAFDAIAEDHGDFEAFLDKRLGIGAPQRAALQRLLLE